MCLLVRFAVAILAVGWMTTRVLLAQQPVEEPTPASTAAPTDADDSGRLIHQIDQLIAQAHVGPSADVCSDEDFLRRVYLDLWGTIPTAQQAREFLGDTLSDRRNRLVDKLLAAPEFARHMAYVFDVWLMERRADKGISRDEWQEYLCQSFAEGKPFDQLARELIAADGASGDRRVRAKFLLDRDCDPNGLVRDVGRMFLGRDLQCAQCHDHPLVDDYAQREYYGLMALVGRSYLFTDKQNNNTLSIGEKADGLPEFHSVFIPDDPPRMAIAGVAERVPIDLPMPEVGNEYVVPPADNARAVPRFSLRAELATGATIDNRAFDKSIVNRLWSHMFGRGLVEPVDMHHSDNPPVHPELLRELAAAMRKLHYDVRQILAAIAKTQAYQRSIDPPTLEEIVAARDGAEQVLRDSAAAQQQHNAALERCEADLEAAAASRSTSETDVQSMLRSVLALRANLAKKMDEVTKKRGELDNIDKQLVDQRAKAQLVTEAAEKAKAALEKLADDPQVRSASEALAAKAATINDSVGKLAAQHDQLAAQVDETDKARHTLQTEVATSQQQLAEANQPLKVAHRQWLDCLERRDFEKAAFALERRRQGLAGRLVALADLAKADNVNSADIDRAYEELSGEWSAVVAVASPRPLSPEQLAWSAWQATGQLGLEEQAATREWMEKHPAPSNLDPTSQSQRQAQLAREVRRALAGRLSGTVNQFAQLFGGGAGQVQTDFHATADQALFLANGGTISNILAPSEGNLPARLNKMSEAGELAEELYLSVLSRRASPEEQQTVASYLTERGEQREAAVRELVWSLLTSAEFRFYR